MIEEADKAYCAGVIDLAGVIRTRKINTDTELPYVALSGSNEAMLRHFARLTGTRAFVTSRNYYKAGCAEHCQAKHQHVVSTSGRWSLSGVKATVLLHNLRPYLRIQADAARDAVLVGLEAPFKAATLRRMLQLGWEAPPEFADDTVRTVGSGVRIRAV